MHVALCEIPLVGAPEILCRERIYAFPAVPQRLALLDKTLLDLPAFQEPQSLCLL